MIKYFLLVAIAWALELPGATGLFLLGLYFVFMTRYRGYYGKQALLTEDPPLESFGTDVVRHGLASQGDVVPFLGDLVPPFLGDLFPSLPTSTAKHVVRKWTWDKIALDATIQRNMAASSEALTGAFERLSTYVRELPKQGSHPYSGTLAVIDRRRARHTPTQAVELVLQLTSDKGWTDQMICALGGAFIICAESYKKEVKTRFAELGKEEPLMAKGTDAELSRLTWKVTQLGNFGKFPKVFADFMQSVFARILPWDRHAVIRWKGEDYYAPTTMFGASATIMKVLKFGETIGLSDKQQMIVGYCVALHWIDKFLNDDTWIRGGLFTPERHSLIEALQGMYAYLHNDPKRAADELVKMYLNADGGSIASSSWAASLDGYLDDEALRRYYAVLRARFNSPRVHFVDPAAAYLALRLPAPDGVRVMQQMIPNAAELVFYPVNNNRDASSQSGGTHWTLIVYDRVHDRFDYYDSQNNPPDPNSVAAHARLARRYNSVAPLTRRRAPQQTESECGVWVLLISEHLAELALHGAEPEVATLGGIEDPRAIIRRALGVEPRGIGSSSLEDPEEKSLVVSRKSAPKSSGGATSLGESMRSAPSPRLRCSKCKKVRRREESTFSTRWHECTGCELVYCDTCGADLDVIAHAFFTRERRCPCGCVTALIY